MPCECACVKVLNVLMRPCKFTGNVANYKYRRSDLLVQLICVCLDSIFGGQTHIHLAMALTTRRIGLCKRRSRKTSRDEQNNGRPAAITSYFETLADNGDSDEIRVSTNKVNSFCDLSTLMPPQRCERLRGSTAATRGDISEAGENLFTPIPSYANKSPLENGVKSQRDVDNDENFNRTSLGGSSETDQDTKTTYMRNRMEIMRHYIGEMVYHNEVFIEGVFLLVFLMAVVYIYLIER